MSLSENIFEKSLKAVLCDDIEVLRNYRPDWLMNPFSGRNLEIDFYIPSQSIAFEIQGEHHYTDEEQMTRDTLKRNLLLEKDITLFEVSIFQIDSPTIYKKLRNFSFFKGKSLNFLKPFDHVWLETKKDILKYKIHIKLDFQVVDVLEYHNLGHFLLPTALQG